MTAVAISASLIFILIFNDRRNNDGKRPGSTHMRQAEGMGRPVHHGKRIRSYSRLLCSRNAQWKGMLVGSEKL